MHAGALSACIGKTLSILHIFFGQDKQDEVDSIFDNHSVLESLKEFPGPPVGRLVVEHLYSPRLGCLCLNPVYPVNPVKKLGKTPSILTFLRLREQWGDRRR